MQPSKRNRKNNTKLFKPKVAKLIPRTTAFLMDFILVAAFASLLLAKIIIPQNYADEYNELEEFIIEKQSQEDLSTVKEEFEELSPKVEGMIQEIQGTYLLAFWVYFAATEIFMRGSSLGKKVFRIRTISLRNLSYPNFFEVVLRAGVKALTIQTFFPVLLISYFIAFWSRQRQAGHDFLARTLVVEEDEFLEEVTDSEDLKEADELEEFER